jgi:hypothetical protein
MMPQQSNPNKFEEDLRASGNILYLLANAHALCINMFIRHSFGTNMPGITGVVSLIMLFLMTAGPEGIVFFWFMVAWLFALLCQRARTTQLVNRGWLEHSYYGGWPWLAMLGGTKSEIIGKKMEPFVCVFLGLLLWPLSPALGKFVAFGFVSMSFVLTTNMAINRRQVTAMRDLRIEQQQMSERMRGLRDDF